MARNKTIITGLFAAVLATAPAFAATFTDIPPQKTPALVFEDGAGAQHALADYRGGYVLLNIWASWCGPCVQEMPSLDALQKDFTDKKLRVIALSEDRNADSTTAFYKNHKITALPVALDQAGMAPVTLHLRGLPTSILIDPQGNQIARLEGDADWTAPAMLDYLKNKMR